MTGRVRIHPDYWRCVFCGRIVPRNQVVDHVVTGDCVRHQQPRPSRDAMRPDTSAAYPLDVVRAERDGS